MLKGFYEGLEVPLDRDWLVIGRGRTADLVIAEPTISRAHAAIGWRLRRFVPGFMWWIDHRAEGF